MNIAVIGAGSGGTNIIQTFSQVEAINISVVIDVNENAPGILLAKKMGIKHQKELEGLDHTYIDIILEVTGNNSVRSKVHELYDGKCEILDSQGAKLLFTLVDRDIEMLHKLNSQISALHEVSNTLIKSTVNSNKHIQDSDKIVQAVNRIAKQTKILGINANIEAARSGEHGKGFAVVANEVQKLADNSEMFALEINRLLHMLSEELGRISQQVDKLNKLSEAEDSTNL